MLHTATSGAGPAVVLLHGFTQTAVAWAPISAGLAERHRVVGVDLPGHGGSGSLRLGLLDTASAVVEVGDLATYVGYSMGARVALRLALDHPDMVERLVLVSGTAGIDGPAERATRRESDEELARTIERDGVDAFLDQWMTQPLFAGFHIAPDDLAARRANTAEGLASSLRLCGTGTMDPPWWDDLSALRALGMEVTVVAGALDTKFRALGERLVAGIGPTARLVVLRDAGHACHLERPDAFVRAAFPETA